MILTLQHLILERGKCTTTWLNMRYLKVKIMTLFNTRELRPEIAAIVESDKLFTKLPTSLLSVSSDAKTVKGEKQGVLTGILYLSPADLISERLNLCPYAVIAGCKAGCLNTAGRGAFSNVQRARIRKTLFWSQYHSDFMALLIADIKRLQRKAARLDMALAIRLNGTSDIQWEYQYRDYFSKETIFEIFPTVQFYDYTKIPRRNVPDNYHLTFSYSGVAEFQPVVEKQLRHNPRTNLAVVFEHTLPVWFLDREVVNGDASDVRFYDAENVVVGLTAKGKAKNDRSGFVVTTGA